METNFLNVASLSKDPSNYIETQKICIKDFPEDIILAIFKKFDVECLFSLRLVNKQWKNLSDKVLRQIVLKQPKSRFIYPTTVLYPNGMELIGQFIRNFYGIGKKTDTYARIVWEGDFKIGQLNGHGKMSRELMFHTEVHEGEFKNDQLHGKGKKINPDRKTVWEGNFKNGQLHGIGKITYKGNVFEEGEFWEGCLHGKGKRFNNENIEEGTFQLGGLVEGRRLDLKGNIIKIYSRQIHSKETN